jgi:hypothetical protein
MLYATIKARIRQRVTASGDAEIIVPVDLFGELIRLLLASVEVDAQWYATEYPDIAEAIAAGRVTSARDHFIHSGYFENRLPYAIKVDEEFYLRTNQDVAKAIADGMPISPTEHFLKRGYLEGRLPSEDFSFFRDIRKI